MARNPAIIYLFGTLRWKFCYQRPHGMVLNEPCAEKRESCFFVEQPAHDPSVIALDRK